MHKPTPMPKHFKSAMVALWLELVKHPEARTKLGVFDYLPEETVEFIESCNMRCPACEWDDHIAMLCKWSPCHYCPLAAASDTNTPGSMCAYGGHYDRWFIAKTAKTRQLMAKEVLKRALAAPTL